MSKTFTLQEAEKLIPSLEKWLGQAIDAKNEAVEAERQLQTVTAHIQMMGGVELELTQVVRQKHAKVRAVKLLQEAMKEIEEAGCLVKDLDIGLVDFPAKLNDQQVYLCWKLGEEHIEFWHHPHEGFAGRKPITTEFGGGLGSGPPN